MLIIVSSSSCDRRTNNKLTDMSSQVNALVVVLRAALAAPSKDAKSIK